MRNHVAHAIAVAVVVAEVAENLVKMLQLRQMKIQHKKKAMKRVLMAQHIVVADAVAQVAKV
jgi:hypothetical protein